MTSRSLPWRRSTLPIPASGYSSICLRTAQDIQASLARLATYFAKGSLTGGKSCSRAWALSAEDCPVNPVRLEFDRNIDLGWLEIMSSNESMRLEATIHSADEAPLDIYSLAVHVIDLKSGVRVAQGDVGVGPGSFVRLRSEIDISALPPGDYEVHVALYDWQTGARLSARDLETEEVSDMHTLHRFHLD